MAEIEPIRLDMQMLGQAMQYQQGQEELAQRDTYHQGQLEIGAAEAMLKTPDLDPIQQYRAANVLAKRAGIQLEPMDYTQFRGDWNAFILSANSPKGGPDSPETQALAAKVLQQSPMAQKQMSDVQRQARTSQAAQGMQSLGSSAAGRPLTTQEGQAVMASPQAQKQMAESVFQDPLKQQQTNLLKERIEEYKIQEAGLVQKQTMLTQFSNSVLPDAGAFQAEAAYRQATGAKGGKSPSALSTLTSGRDDLAAQYGVLNKDERKQVSSQADQQWMQLRGTQMQLRQQLTTATQDVSGTADVQGIQNKLEAVSAAMQLKLGEKLYFKSGSEADFQRYQQAHQQYQGLMQNNKAQIQSLRNAQLGLHGGSEEAKQLLQNNLTQAQAKFLQGDQSDKLAADLGLQFNVLPEAIKKAGAVGKPLTSVETKIDMGLGKELGTGAADIVKESYNAAIGASNTLDAVSRISAAIDQGKVLVGPGATIRQKADQIAQIMGVAGNDTQERLVNTRDTIRGLAQFAIAARKQLKGQGQVSDYEGRLIQSAEAGTIDDFTVPELSRFLQVTERLSRKQLSIHEHNMSIARRNPKLADVMPFYEMPYKYIANDDELNQFPSGTKFIGPGETKIRVKP